MSSVYEPMSFDPLSTERITNTICEMFERQPLVSMAKEIPRFEGAGLYAIYYLGNSDPYKALANLQVPVYVGQSLSNNSSTGKKKDGLFPVCDRLRKHRVSIIDGGLLVDEFRFRALLMPDVHTNLGEKGLIRGYKPVWNSILTGFGSNEQGSATRKSKKSKWDTVHSGRRRTHGGVVHEVDELTSAVITRITEQAKEYESLPWPHPESITLIDLD